MGKKYDSEFYKHFYGKGSKVLEAFSNDLFKLFYHENQSLFLKNCSISNVQIINSLMRQYRKPILDIIKSTIRKEIDFIRYSGEFEQQIMNSFISVIYSAFRLVIKELLLLEITYFQIIHEPSRKKGILRINGKYLGYDCIADEYYLKTKNLPGIIGKINILNKISSLFIIDKTKLSVREIAKLNNENKMLRILNDKNVKRYDEKNNGKGRKPRFMNKNELHIAIKKIADWEQMTVSQLSIKLCMSKNWLGQLLKEKGWELPKAQNHKN